MRYIQKVKIDCSDIKKVKGEFNNILFLKHLTKLLPVKIIEWDGTYDGAKAHLAFWFFGWRDFIVNHRENIEDDIKFSFVLIFFSAGSGLLNSSAFSNCLFDFSSTMIFFMERNSLCVIPSEINWKPTF